MWFRDSSIYPIKISRLIYLSLICIFVTLTSMTLLPKQAGSAQQHSAPSLFIPLVMKNHSTEPQPGPTPVPDPNETISILLIPTSGNTLSNLDNSVQILFPEGAVDVPVIISYYYQSSPSHSFTPLSFAGISFRLTAIDEDGNPVAALNKPFSMMLTYQEEDLQAGGIGDENTLNIYFWGGSGWVGLLPCDSCHRNPANNRIVASLDFMGEFTLLGIAEDQVTSTPTSTASPSATATLTPSTTATITPSATATFTATATHTPSFTPTVTITPTEMPPPGDPGFALEFDGNNDFVELHETDYMLAEGWESLKSVSLWVRPMGSATVCDNNDVAKCDNIFGDRPRWWGISRGIRNSEDRIWVWNYDGNYDIIGVSYTSDEWVQITMVHNDGMLTAYIDGELVDSIPSGETLQPPANPVLHLGTIITGDIWPFEGQIDEVRIWNIVLSQEEIINTLYWPLSGDEPGLAAYYRMSDGEGLSLTDDSGNGWTGTLHDGGHGVPPDGSPPEWVDSGAFGVLQQSNFGFSQAIELLRYTWQRAIITLQVIFEP